MISVGATCGRLFLVGTCHRDPQGLHRCRILLEALDPAVVLVEVSPFAVRMRRDHRRFFLRWFQKNLATAAKAHGISFTAALRSTPAQWVLMQCAFPFELRAARQRHALYGTPYFCVDLSEASRLFMSDWPNLLSSENLKGLLGGNNPAPSAGTEEYRRARTALDGLRPASHVFFRAGSSVWAVRERWLEKTVRATLWALKPPSLVYLGGWSHVVPNNGLSLFDRVRDLAPVSLLLDEADRLERPLKSSEKPRGHCGQPSRL